MTSLAQQRFEEITGSPLISKRQKIPWPALMKALQAGCLSYVDLAFAEFLLGGMDEGNELAGAFLCHLSRSVREGHLCVIKRGNEIHPSPHNLWFSDVSDGDINEVKMLLDELVEKELVLPDKILTIVGDGMDITPVTPLCRYNNLYYFQKYWLFESAFTERLASLVHQSPELELNEELIGKTVSEMRMNQLLNDRQADAILNATQTCFSIICGGPGTGKTYTAGHLIKIFWNSLTPEERTNCNIALAAPTGKAANNLQMSLERACTDVENVKGLLKAKTLHALLELKSARRIGHRPNKKLNADLILVDESSMIDVRLISYLIDSIKPGARLILLGDPHQLPPVEAGSAFNDVIDSLSKLSSRHVFKLETCIRAELMEIVDFSTKLNDGNVASVLKQLNSADNNSPVSRIRMSGDESPRKVLAHLLEYSQKHIPDIRYNELSHTEKDSAQWKEEIVQLFNSFRLLTPLRNGPFGVKDINHHIHQERMSNTPWDDFLIEPIIITANNYKMNLFNGDVGVLISKKSNGTVFQEGDFALFGGEGEMKFRQIPAILLPKFEYSYCLSIHKSQGSEFDHVLLLMPEGSERFGREVFYTAATRAKKKLEVWGADHTLKQTIENRSERLSGIPDRMLKMA